MRRIRLPTCASVVHLPASGQVKTNSALIRWGAIDLGRFLIVAIGTSWVAVVILSIIGYGDSPITGFVPRVLVVALILVIVGSPLVVVFLAAWAWVDRRVPISRSAVIVGSLVVGSCFAYVALQPGLANTERFLLVYLAFLPTWLLFGFALRKPPPWSERLDAISTRDGALGSAVALGGLIVAAGSFLDWATEDGGILMYFRERDGLETSHGFLALLAGIGIAYIGVRMANTGSSRAFARGAIWLAMLVLADLGVALALFAFEGRDGGVILHAPNIGMIFVAVGALLSAIAGWRFAYRFREGPLEA